MSLIRALRLVWVLLLFLTPTAFAVYPLSGVYINSDGSPLIPLIRAAQTTLDVEIYTMTDRLVRQEFRAALARRVRIRVVKDSTGNTVAACNVFDPAPSPNPDCDDQKKLTTEIKKGGGAFVPFNQADFCGVRGEPCFQHGKMVIADGKVAMLSSGNFEPTSLCHLQANPARCNRDYSVIISQPGLVVILNAVFEKDVLAKAYDLKSLLASFPGAAQLTVSPLSLAPLLAFIRSARTSLIIQNQYLHEPNINSALREVAKRGVKVSINIASPCAFGRPSAGEAQSFATIFKAFDEAGVESRMFTRRETIQGKPGYLHAKAILVDSKTAWVGSVNGSTHAVSRNREFGLFFSDVRAVRVLEDRMVADFRSENGETWQEGLRCLRD